MNTTGVRPVSLTSAMSSRVCCGMTVAGCDMAASWPDRCPAETGRTAARLTIGRNNGPDETTARLTIERTAGPDETTRSEEPSEDNETNGQVNGSRRTTGCDAASALLVAS